MGYLRAFHNRTRRTFVPTHQTRRELQESGFERMEVVGPDGLCADLVTPGDVGELTGALAALLDDPERRAEMGRNGRKRVQELFSWRAVASQVAEVYESAVADYAAEHSIEKESADAHR